MLTKTKAGQFHQLLAVMGDKVQQGNKLLAEAAKTFQKGEMFEGYLRTYTPFDEDGDKQPDEGKELITTVTEKLDFILPYLADSINVQLSREASNASGGLKANLLIGDRDFGEFSSQELLQLEKSVRELREHIVNNLPTLDMAKAWKENDDEREGTSVTQEAPTYRYVEETVPVVLAPATDKHPAQVREAVKKTQVGEFSRRIVSGKISPAVKADMMSRVDKMLSAIADARSRANSNEATNVKFGFELLEFLFYNQ